MHTVHVSTPVPAYPAQADPLLVTTKALPAAGASANAAAIDLGQTLAFPASEKLALEVVLPDCPSLADAKTVTITVEDSADNSSFAAVPELSTVVITGAGGAGATGVTRRFPVPPSLRRYVRFSAAVAAAGGTNTAITAQLTVLVRL